MQDRIKSLVQGKSKSYCGHRPEDEQHLVFRLQMDKMHRSEATAMKQYNSWDEIDKDTGGLVTSLTYIVLFVNDQVYNFEMQLSDHIKGCGLYRQKVKMLVNSMDRQMAAYNRRICRTAGVNAEAMALITQSMEDDIKPHIDRYGFTVSQALHNAGCHEDLNKALSICSTVDMLCQTSQITIRDFFTAISKYAPLAYNPLQYLTMDKMLHFARELTEVLTPKEIHVNLNELPEIANAFQAIANNMLRAEVFEKAFESCEK